VLVVVGDDADPTVVDAAGAGPPAVAFGGGGPGGGVSGLVLATVVGGFLCGFGIASFLVARK
jgi:hypothetical protein